MIDVLFVAKNRKRYTVNSFEALLANTDWNDVEKLYVHDDGSEDGTVDYLGERCDQWGGSRIDVDVVFHDRPLGGPVAAMNWYLDQAHERGESDRFAKIDSDFIVCPGWLPEVLHQMIPHPGIDAFGLQPRFGPAVAPPSAARGIDEARFIGGIGVVRHRVFERCRPRPSGFNGYQGWTQFQTAHDFRKAWMTPDLPCFCLDLLPFEPWISQAAEYVEKGWMRAWPTYESAGDSYWSWWQEIDA